MIPPSGGARSVIPPAPSTPTAILDIEELIAPIALQLRAATTSVVASLEAARSEALLSTERSLVELATAIAERVIGRELRTEPELVAKWAHDGIAALHGEDAVTIVASPDVAMHLEGSFVGAHVKIEVDFEAKPGSCRVNGRWGHVDASVRARLDATIGALEPPDAAGADASRSVLP